MWKRMRRQSRRDILPTNNISQKQIRCGKRGGRKTVIFKNSSISLFGTKNILWGKMLPFLQ
jgi:hypothetical protein